MYFPRHAGHDMAGMDMGGATTSTSGGHDLAMKMYVHGTIGGDVLWFRSWQPTSAGATVGVCIGLFLFAILDRYVHALWRACTAAWARGEVGFALPRSAGAEPYVVVRDRDRDDDKDLDDAQSRREPITATAISSAIEEKEQSCCGRKTAGTDDKLGELDSDAFAPAPCTCGCGGECGGSSAAPVYREVPTPESEKMVAAGAGTTTSTRAASIATAPVAAYLPAAARRTLDPRRPGRWSRPFRWSADVPRGLLWAVQTIIHFLLMLTVMTFNLWWIISVVVGAGVGEALFGRFGSR